MNPFMRNPWVDKNLGPFREGERVRFPFDMSMVEGTVVEDRGHLGVGGKRLYGVTFLPDDVSPPSYTALEIEDLTLIARDGKPAPTR